MHSNNKGSISIGMIATQQQQQNHKSKVLNSRMIIQEDICTNLTNNFTNEDELKNEYIISDADEKHHKINQHLSSHHVKTLINYPISVTHKKNPKIINGNECITKSFSCMNGQIISNSLINNGINSDFTRLIDMQTEKKDLNRVGLINDDNAVKLKSCPQKALYESNINIKSDYNLHNQTRLKFQKKSRCKPRSCKPKSKLIDRSSKLKKNSLNTIYGSINEELTSDNDDRDDDNDLTLPNNEKIVLSGNLGKISLNQQLNITINNMNVDHNNKQKPSGSLQTFDHKLMNSEKLEKKKGSPFILCQLMKKHKMENWASNAINGQNEAKKQCHVSDTLETCQGQFDMRSSTKENQFSKVFRALTAAKPTRSDIPEYINQPCKFMTSPEGTITIVHDKAKKPTHVCVDIISKTQNFTRKKIAMLKNGNLKEALFTQDLNLNKTNYTKTLKLLQNPESKKQYSRRVFDKAKDLSLYYRRNSSDSKENIAELSLPSYCNTNTNSKDILNTKDDVVKIFESKRSSYERGVKYPNLMELAMNSNSTQQPNNNILQSNNNINNMWNSGAIKPAKQLAILGHYMQTQHNDSIEIYDINSHHMTKSYLKKTKNIDCILPIVNLNNENNNGSQGSKTPPLIQENTNNNNNNVLNEINIINGLKTIRKRRMKSMKKATGTENSYNKSILDSEISVETTNIPSMRKSNEIRSKIRDEMFNAIMNSRINGWDSESIEQNKV